MTDTADYGEPECCTHSMIVADCASCWHGVAVRQNNENDRLREALRRLLMDGVQECDPWSGYCACSTFQARKLLGDPPRQGAKEATSDRFG